MHEEVSEVVSKYGAVFVAYLEGLLALDCQPELSEPVSESIFIDFLKMSISEIYMQLECGLPNCVA